MNLRLLKKADFWLGSLLAGVLSPPAWLLRRLLRRDHAPELRGQLVVVKILGGGSLLIALPALLGLRRRYPNRRFTLLCSPAVAKFAELSGVFDDMAIISTDRPAAFLTSCLKALGMIFRADAVLNLEIHSRLTGVFCLLTCARNRIGLWMNWNRWQTALITHALFYNDSAPIYVAYNQAARLLGAEPLDMAETARSFRAFNDAPPPAAPRDDKAPRVALAPYCSDLAPEREFDDRQWVEIVRRHCPQPNGELFVFGGPADRERADRTVGTLAAALPGWRITSLAGRLSLRDSVRRLCDMDLLLTIDSGVNHIARLVRAPVASYWGPTDPSRRLAPFDDGVREEVHYQKIFCSPCVHLMDQAPCDGDNLCMQQYLAPLDPEKTGKGWLLREARR
jgi:ADP-heptose:LPS heptosyltransferase